MVPAYRRVRDALRIWNGFAVRKPIPTVCRVFQYRCESVELAASSAETRAVKPRPLPRVATPQSLALWRDYLKRAPVPRHGCFTATYPILRWRDTPCKTGPLRPYVVGGGAGDFEAHAAQGASIHLAQGSFRSVTGIPTESDSVTGGSNEFSVQLNTNRFDTRACKNAALANCKGWQQFVFASDVGQLSMQYWLVNFGPTCPVGWVSDSTRAPNSCYQNGLNQLQLVNFATGPVGGSWSTLPEYSMIASATPQTDTLIMVDNERRIAKAISNSDFVLGLASGWTDVEFNIFGLCCGSQATFNQGSTIVLGVSLDTGSFVAPTCPNASFTAETNNLTLSTTDPLGPPQSWPRMQFTESNTTPPTPPTCRTIGGNGQGINASIAGAINLMAITSLPRTRAANLHPISAISTKDPVQPARQRHAGNHRIQSLALPIGPSLLYRRSDRRSSCRQM